MIAALVAGLLIFGCTTGNVGRARAPGELTARMVLGEYTVKTFASEDEGRWEVARNGRLLLRGHGWRFHIGMMPHEDECFPAELLGKDITGNGKPDIVIFEWTGGAHACFVARVIALDEQAGDCRLLAEIDGIDSLPRFKDLDGDGVLEIVLHDMTFRYWPGCFANSPMPRVVLRWQNDKYVADARLTATPMPDSTELAAKAANIAQDPEWDRDRTGVYSCWCIPQSLFQTALDLMYGGHEEQGWEFIRLAWTPKYPLDQALSEELRGLLQHSPYWRTLKRERAGG